MWLIDTNVIIQAQRGHPDRVASRLRTASPAEVAVSTITIAELWYGCSRSPDPERKRALWSRFIEPYDVLSFDRAAAENHGVLRHELRHHPIGERDLLIAAIAVANDMVVVTANRLEFERVPGLVVEDWSI